jgi:hypothetical protein
VVRSKKKSLLCEGINELVTPSAFRNKCVEVSKKNLVEQEKEK